MRTNSESPPPKKIRRLGLQQNQEHVEAVVLQNTTTMTTTIHQLAVEVIGISLGLLGGNGHYRYGPLACKMFLRASELSQHFKKITTGESVTSSVSCAKKFFSDKGTGKDQLEFIWLNAARYGRVDVMEWAHEQGYSAIKREEWQPWLGCWNPFGAHTCKKAAEYGKLQALQWLRENGCDWDAGTCAVAALNGHLSILQWARDNGCEWNEKTCAAAACNGHLSILQWVRENGCD